MSPSAQRKDELALTEKDAREIKKSLVAFSKSANVLSSNHPRMIEKYPDQWVAVGKGKVLAHGKSIDAVLKKVDKMGIDRADIIVRLIEKNLRTFIL